ncbi:MAG: hypothetical protein KDB21_12270 [Acidimicrobiales bacterium]|nr:hypothetical protein [Acidimicrobiales bacterium]
MIAAACWLLGLFALVAAPALAQDDTDDGTPAPTPVLDDGAQVGDAGFVDVIEVSGLLDPVLADFVTSSLDAAERDGAVALVLQLNSRDSVLDRERLNELARRFADSSVTVAVWVGPSGSRALNEVAQLVGVADVVGVAPGARLGRTGEQVLNPDEFGQVWGEHADVLRNDDLDWREVIDAGVVPCERVDVDELGRPVSEEEQQVRCAAVTVGDFLLDLDGFQSRQVSEADEIRLEPLTLVRFQGLSLLDQLMHTVASPPVAYLLFIIGLGLLLFEFFTAGVGVAGVVGAVCFLLGSYGLAVLETRGWAIALIVIALLGYGIDVQTGVPRAWTAIATVCFVLGTLFLYSGPGMSWIPTVVGIGGMLLAMLAGMPAMVRTRFSTPTIGREWMIGELGEVVESVSPDGVVRIRGALWRARTNRATPSSVGDSVRVVALEGLFLEVEPEEGGAVDYREKARKG